MALERRLTVSGRYPEIRKICQFVAEGAAAAGFDDDTVFHLELCCDEASTNIIEHAYGGEGIGRIDVITTTDDQAFTVRLQDKGRPFNPETVPAPPDINGDLAAGASADDLSQQLQVGGLGLHFIRNLMDEVYFTFDTDRGNTMVMVKYLQGKDVP
jgi:anti-sigma regulatory factor (Ser/Thr protein kinase)